MRYAGAKPIDLLEALEVHWEPVKHVKPLCHPWSSMVIHGHPWSCLRRGELNRLQDLEHHLQAKCACTTCATADTADCKCTDCTGDCSHLESKCFLHLLFLAVLPRRKVDVQMMLSENTRAVFLFCHDRGSGLSLLVLVWCSLGVRCQPQTGKGESRA